MKAGGLIRRWSREALFQVSAMFIIQSLCELLLFYSDVHHNIVLLAFMFKNFRNLDTAAHCNKNENIAQY